MSRANSVVNNASSLRRILKRSSLLLAAFFVCILVNLQSSHADEYYWFYSFRCFKEIGVARIEKIGVWNVDYLVWPTDLSPYPDRKSRMLASWQQHERNLKSLEDKYGLYVFGEPYGRYSEDPIRCELPRVVLDIISDKLERDYVTVGDPRVSYRGPMTFRIMSKDGNVLMKGTVGENQSFQIQDSDSSIIYSSCGLGEHCEEKVLR